MYCYGKSRRGNETYDELTDWNRKWWDRIPESFSPLYDDRREILEDELFLVLWFLSDCDVTGVQHVDLAQILLAVFNPEPRD